jgi:hypothetical protein
MMPCAVDSTGTNEKKMSEPGFLGLQDDHDYYL